MKKGELKQAKKYFDKACEIAPFSNEIKAHLRELLSKNPKK